MTRAHVLAYGGYFTLLLFLFFTPVFVAERLSAQRIARGQALAHSPELEAQLGLHASLGEQLLSTFGLLSPLLGALASRLLG